MRQPSSWRFNRDMFKNEKLKQEIFEEIKESNFAEDWDFCKIYLQSIMRAFRKPKAPENKISKLNNEITKINEEIANSSQKDYLTSNLDELNIQLQEELTNLAEKWQIRSKTQWIEQGEKSTKYFFARYKQRKSQVAQTEIKDPDNPS